MSKVSKFDVHEKRACDHSWITESTSLPVPLTNHQHAPSGPSLPNGQ